jgi:metal-sulfur cluster biosynthetic enzyme
MGTRNRYNINRENVKKSKNNFYDPEIPVDIYELGLIYDVMVNTK